jgi:hypothetical protein
MKPSDCLISSASHGILSSRGLEVQLSKRRCLEWDQGQVNSWSSTSSLPLWESRCRVTCAYPSSQIFCSSHLFFSLSESLYFCSRAPEVTLFIHPRFNWRRFTRKVSLWQTWSLPARLWRKRVLRVDCGTEESTVKNQWTCFAKFDPRSPKVLRKFSSRQERRSICLRPIPIQLVKIGTSTQ